MQFRPFQSRAACTVLAAVIVSAFAGIPSGHSQEQAAPAAPAVRSGPYRSVAPGVEITIPPARQEDETFSTHDVVEILQGVPNLKWDPKQSPASRTLLEMATSTIFRHKIWYLELTFKPVRMIWVDIPQETGKMQRKLIWYMVYHVKNTGKHLSPRRNEDGTFTIDPVDEEVRFFPQFVLESPEFDKAYLDRLVPAAMLPIQQREDPNRRLLNSVEISLKAIPLSTDQVDNSVWGVAMWEEVDPRIDFFSIYIEGLTNAYKWFDQPGKPPGEGRVLTQKNLVLNFWRPGDEEMEDQRVMRFGVPDEVSRKWEEIKKKRLYLDVDHRWVYR